MWITQHIKDAFFGDHHRHFHLFDRNSLSCCSCLWYYFYFYYYYYCGSLSQEAQNRNQDWLCGDNNQRPHTRFFEARNVTHLSPSAERVNVDDRRRRLLRRLGSCCRDAIDSHACAHSFFSFYVSLFFVHFRSFIYLILNVFINKINARSLTCMPCLTHSSVYILLLACLLNENPPTNSSPSWCIALKMIT